VSASDVDALAGTLAVDLYSVLSDLDPDRWRRDRAPALRARLSTIEARFRGLLEGSLSLTDGLASRLSEVVEVIEAHLGETPEVERRSRWMRLRRRLSAAYAGLAIHLRAQAIPIPVHRPSNYARNGFHIGSAAAAVLTALLWPEGMVWIIGPVFALFWSLEAVRPFSRRVNRRLMRLFQHIAHPQEAHRVNSATWYATSLMLLAWLAPPVVGAGAVAVLGLGDPVAGFVGRRWGRRRIAHGRTLEGSLAFLLVGGLGCFAITALSGLAWPVALAGGLVAGLVGACAELACGPRFDDNLVVPLLAGAALWPTLHLLG